MPILKSSRGFTLVELMITVAVLAFGIVSIYEALFISMDTYGFYASYLDTQDWFDQEILEIQDQLTQKGSLETKNLSGRIVRGRRTFDWSVMISPVDEDLGLYKIDATLSWKQGSRNASVSRAAYLLSPHLKEYNEENFV
ncbi:MAG: prepilin-type N-terminal cleavage/methylation domain-containing protein [Candidatus Omnitrophica bacterium]|nr:prepilin-type N-terminal cleavage/methylation domain-containing protein [Candidatus Omnitrophota bacterium]